jgi:mannose-6-phosphate isomerase
MTHFYKLENTVQHYKWGSPLMIPELLGAENHSMIPWAELWMGSHSGAPSICIDDENKRKINLADLIKENPEYYLGDGTMKAFDTLPFLYKVLSADKPLSIQAHPNLEQAVEGFARENTAGIDIKAAKRNFKDTNHKPEIMCALTPFTAMCGFREIAEIEKLFAILNCSALDAPLAALKDSSSDGGLKGFLGALFAMNTEDRKLLTDTILENGRDFALKNEKYRAEFDLCVQFAQLHPDDPSIIAPLYLNLIELQPGEAIFLSAGVLHAYVHGLGMELMANSDNVLRGGLTSKYIDAEELKKVLIFVPFMPEIIKPADESASCSEQSFFTYKTECKDFELKHLQHRGTPINYLNTSPSIMFVTSGNLTIKDTENGKKLELHRGESVFVAPTEKSGTIILEGDFEIFSASTGIHDNL